MTASAASNWFSLAELAGMGLPGLPRHERPMRALAAAEEWSRRNDGDGQPLARKRNGKGGGTEYHASVLPLAAQEALLARRNRHASLPIAEAETSCDSAAEAWARFNRLPTKAKAKAERRIAILAEIVERMEAGMGKAAATAEIARARGVGTSAVAEWFALVKGVARHNWLPHLVPQYKGGGKPADIDSEAWQVLLSDYLRPEKPAFAACYTRLLEEYARPRGIELPHMRTLKRRADWEISEREKVRKREGKEALRRMIPPQIRSVAGLHALERVNADGHRADLFVQWEDGKIERPIMVGIQDIYSRKVLAWSIDRTESTRLVRRAFANLFRDWGIPGHAHLDNGRGFAAKSMTGGAKTRFRFKIDEDEMTGVLTQLGVITHWTLPYRGSSKPIERAWRDLCETIAKHPAVAGAYTGNRPDAKPDNYRERAIPIEQFRAHVARQIDLHNARQGRRTEMAKGRLSFDEVFAQSYATSAIGKATGEHLRIALCEARKCKAHMDDGSIVIAGNSYWSEEMGEHRGKWVIARFDPDNLHSDVDILALDGRQLCVAELRSPVGFKDLDAAKERARAEAKLRKTERDAEAQRDRLTAAQLAELFSGHAEAPATPKPKAGATRMVRPRGAVAAALKPLQQINPEPDETLFIDQLAAGVRKLRAID